MMMTGHRQRACAYVQCCACNRTVILFPVDILQVSLTTQLSSAIMAVPAHHDKRSSIEKADIERIEQVSDAPTPTHQLLERRWRHRHHHMEDMVRHLHTFVPTIAAMMGKLAIQFGAPTANAWSVPAYTTANAIGFLLAGANSDLFGR
jgi:hypothetical protein